MEQPDLGGRGGRFFSFKWRQNNILDLKLFFFFLLFYFILFIYGYAGPSLPLRPFSRGEQGPACSGSGGLLAVVAALGGAQALGRLGASSCRSWAPQLWRARLVLHGMWDLSRPGIDPCLLLLQVDFLPLSHQGGPGAAS